MINKEVIEILNDMKGVFGKRGHSQYAIYAINKAIEALEKQIPKRVLNKRYVDYDDLKNLLIGHCEACRWNVSCYEMYCSNCGQKLDWE